MQGLLGCGAAARRRFFAAREMVCRLKTCTFIFAMAQWITDIFEALPGSTYTEPDRHFNQENTPFLRLKV